MCGVSGGLPPVIQNMKLIRNGNAGSFEISNGSNDVRVFHVPIRVVIESNCDDSRVLALNRLDEQMKVLEVVMVSS